MSKNHLQLARLQSEAGQSTILVAVLCLAFVAILAIVIESGLIYSQKRNLQNTVDAAALAGAQELDGTADSGTLAENAASDWADLNISELGVLGLDVNDPQYTQIRVTAEKPAASAFFGWLSFGSPDVPAAATARIAAINNLAACVVPIGVRLSVYQDAVADPNTLVTLRYSDSQGPSGSNNTGLINLGPGNSAVPIAEGACGLTAQVDTKPGETVGDVNNGFQDRLKAAIAAGCYTERTAAEWNSSGCLAPTLESDGVQATALVLLPILNTNLDNLRGQDDVPVLPVTTPEGETNYRLAYFWVDGDASFDQSNSNNWKCKVQTGPDSCELYGKFVFGIDVDLAVFKPENCPPGGESCVIDFDPNSSVNKIIQLIE